MNPVRLSRAFYQTLPAQWANYYAKDFFGPFDNTPGTHPLGRVTVEHAHVLDLTSVRWRFLLPTAEPSVYSQAGDWYIAGAVRLYLKLDGAEAPIEYGYTDTAPTGLPTSGMAQLNANFFQWEDMPFHIVITQTSALVLEYRRLPDPIFTPPDGTLIGVQVRGRWISKSMWESIKEATA